MENSAISLSIIILVFILIKEIRHPHWAIRFFDFPQVQILVFAIAVLIMDLFALNLQNWHNLALILALTAGILYEMKIILPYTPLYAKQSADAGNQSADLSIIVSNVYMENREYSRFTDMINRIGPEILITLETDQGWEDALQPLRTDYPYGVNIPRDNMYGLHLYSKISLEDLQVRYLVEDDVPSVSTIARLPSGRRIRLYAIHPKPPSPTENEESLERDGELFIIAREVRNSRIPVIVAGDLNDVAWSHSTRLFQRISRLLDPRIGRGFFNTFHSRIPIMRWPLDHFFHSDHFTIASMKRLENIGSDHFPIYIALALMPGDENGDSPPKADEQDHQESRQVIVEAKMKN